MALQLHNSKLLIGPGGALANDPDCCCDPPDPCACNDGSTDQTIKSLRLVLGGSTTPKTTGELVTPPYSCNDVIPSTCPDIMGTYTIACGDTLAAVEDIDLVCTSTESPTREVHYFIKLDAITWTGQNSVVVTVSSGSWFGLATGTPDTTNVIQTKTWTISVTKTGTCPTSLSAAVLIDPPFFGSGACDLTPMTLTASLV